MTSNPYTPDEAELIGCYAGAMEEQAGENYATAKADAERGIAVEWIYNLKAPRRELPTRVIPGPTTAKEWLWKIVHVLSLTAKRSWLHGGSARCITCD